MVFAAEAGWADGRLNFRTMEVDWPALASTHKPVILVVRMGVEFARLLQAPDGGGVASALAQKLESLTKTVGERGVAVAGIQLDYDCPTAQVRGYARLMQELHRQMPATRWSVTTLPDWLRSRSFRSLVKGLDFFVLQVHSFRKPAGPDDAKVLCDPVKIPEWSRQAARAGAPFYLALPTYGYQMIFDSAGRFAGLIAENRAVMRPRDGMRVTTVSSNPEAMAGIVRELRGGRLGASCRGIAWFRLPVETDRLNWSWPALRAVMNGRVPTTRYAAEVRSVSADLFELRVRNAGERDDAASLSLTLALPDRPLIARDLMNGYGEGEDRATISGPAPRLGRPILAGWFRFAPSTSDLSTSFTVQRIDVFPKSTDAGQNASSVNEEKDR